MAGKNFLGEFEELVMLAILKIGNDAYGVPIASVIEEATGKRVSTGALYTALSRLEEKGFISSRMGEVTAARGGKAKKFYEVEATGREIIRKTQNARNALLADLTLVLT